MFDPLWFDPKSKVLEHGSRETGSYGLREVSQGETWPGDCGNRLRLRRDSRISKRWPEEVSLVNPYACLCSWADCHRHIAENKQDADVSWNLRRLPTVEALIVQHGMLNEAFHTLVMELRE
jgi:hypothetical protein